MHGELASVARQAQRIARRPVRRWEGRACKSGGRTFTCRREGVSETRCGFWYKPTAAGMHSCTRDLETMPRIVRRDVCPRVAIGRIGRGGPYGRAGRGPRGGWSVLPL